MKLTGVFTAASLAMVLSGSHVLAQDQDALPQHLLDSVADAYAICTVDGYAHRDTPATQQALRIENMANVGELGRFIHDFSLDRGMSICIEAPAPGNAFASFTPSTGQISLVPEHDLFAHMQMTQNDIEQWLAFALWEEKTHGMSNMLMDHGYGISMFRLVDFSPEDAIYYTWFHESLGGAASIAGAWSAKQEGNDTLWELAKKRFPNGKYMNTAQIIDLIERVEAGAPAPLNLQDVLLIAYNAHFHQPSFIQSKADQALNMYESQLFGYAQMGDVNFMSRDINTIDLTDAGVVLGVPNFFEAGQHQTMVRGLFAKARPDQIGRLNYLTQQAIRLRAGAAVAPQP